MPKEPTSLVEVAVPCPIKQTFTYGFSQKHSIIGYRVKVQFGARKLVGIVVSQLKPSDSIWAAPDKMKKIRQIIDLIDDSPIFSAVLLQVGFWMSRYYCHPIGEVFASMLPASSTKTTTNTWTLSDLGCREVNHADSMHGAVLAFIFLNKKSLSLATVRSRLKEAEKKELAQPGSSDLGQLLNKKLLISKKTSEVRARLSAGDKQAKNTLPLKQVLPTPTPTPTPTPEQADAIAEMQADLASSDDENLLPCPFLLWGITGSGKTEVYLQHISSLLKRHPEGQILVLVPEISLTPQMTEVFSLRFPRQVAVSHSKLSPRQRWQVWESLRAGSVSILISPRSGVFAPFSDLRLIVVDEEHDSSYKQNSKLQYNGRDIAVLRAKLEHAQCLLGSATPSLESYQNALDGKYKLLRLRKRAKGAKLPKIQVISPPVKKGAPIVTNPSNSSSTSLVSDGFEPIAPEVINALALNLDQGKQAIVLVNRRGYSAYLLDLEKKEGVQCPSCSISLTLHRMNFSLKCHYCGFSTKVETLQLKNPKTHYYAVGYGSQKAEEFISHKLPKARIARLDSDVASDRDHLTKTLEQFRCRESDILLGTQMLAKGHDFPGVALTVILDCDKMLNLPDFRAGERTFQLLVQAAGRAGRQEDQGQVLVQSVERDHPVIVTGLRHDYEQFAIQELALRRIQGFPPFTRQILWEINSTCKDRLDSYCIKLENALLLLCESLKRNQPERFRQINILGPMNPSIEKIMTRFRKMVLFTCRDVLALQEIHEVMLREIPRPPGDIRLNVDVDPQSLL